MDKYCHRALSANKLTHCLKQNCTMWCASEEECYEVFILHYKAIKIWSEEQ